MEIIIIIIILALGAVSSWTYVTFLGSWNSACCTTMACYQSFLLAPRFLFLLFTFSWLYQYFNIPPSWRNNVYLCNFNLCSHLCLCALKCQSNEEKTVLCVWILIIWAYDGCFLLYLFFPLVLWELCHMAEELKRKMTGEFTFDKRGNQGNP